MHERILDVIRQRVVTRRYVMTLHAEEEMNDDEFTIFDVEHGLLTGSIAQRQKDSGTAEWKYLVEGQSLGGKNISVVAKLSLAGTLVIITVYAG